jgi:DNA-binding response OmpR family regulator/two-component sensor histidine kinase
LDLSKLEGKEMQVNTSKVELVRFFRTLASSFHSLSESRKIVFNIEQNQSEVWAMIDRDKVEKIITNLLSNAFKFTQNGKSISIKIDYLLEKKRFLMQIQDGGIGIESNKIDKIFDRFYQAEDAQNRRFEGTGIGLALVKELVEVMNGTIRVESKLGVGTAFFVELPFKFSEGYNVEDNTELTVQKVINEPNQLLQNTDSQLVESENILLIVDDNADIRAYIRSIFESSYQIVEAVNGREGIEKAIETTPNLIISDLMMPEMDGFEFCKYLKTHELTSHIPVIMLTAKANIESRIEGLELGADDYLIKPFNAKEIQVRVKNLLDKQEVLKQYFSGKTTELKPTELIRIRPIEAQFLMKAKSIVEQHLSENNFGIEQFCEALNMSPRQLLRKLKALTNQTTVEFIRDYRLQRASEMLEQGEGSVSDVAFAVGMESLSYFTKTFQEKFGHLPSEYVEKVK